MEQFIGLFAILYKFDYYLYGVFYICILINILCYFLCREGILYEKKRKRKFYMPTNTRILSKYILICQLMLYFEFSISFSFFKYIYFIFLLLILLLLLLLLFLI